MIKKIAALVPYIRAYRKKTLIKQGHLQPASKLWLEDAEKVLLDKQLNKRMLVGLHKDYSDKYEDYIPTRAFSPMFERFLRNNKINFEYFDISNSNWQQQAERFDVILWHVNSHPISQMEAAGKIYLLEKKMNKVCLPSFNELWSYEDKINCHYLYKHFQLPEIPTYIFFNKDEAINFIEKADYPIISKLTCGSSSLGTFKINNKRHAKKLVKEVFSNAGRATYWPYLQQHGYVYFQDFIPDCRYDLRVIVVGNKLFGYYRYPKKNDYRASGSGIYRKFEIEPRALDLAWEVKQKFNNRFLATDFLFSEKHNSYFIIESSFFIGIDTCEQLIVDGVPGFYEKTSSGYTFKPGKYWLQELLLNEVFSNL